MCQPLMYVGKLEAGGDLEARGERQMGDRGNLMINRIFYSFVF